MTCNACGGKPKNTAKDFTKAVIEINNPETLVLLRKVVIPTSMGTEEDVPAAIGKYHNVILYYEANRHTYLYSSDGIPTLLETEVPQEILDKIDQLEDGLEQETTVREGADEALQLSISAVAQDLEDFKNSPDVVDIVSTYAALQAYDTSGLGDNDEIRVLTDETHDGASAYYRWDKTNSRWVFIGITGPYYTKSEIDATVQGLEGDIEDVQSKIGQAEVLTVNDYNWNSQTRTAVEPFDSIALWLLDSGIYSIPSGITAYTHIHSQSLQSFDNGLIIISSDETFSGQDVVSMISLHYSNTYPGHVSGQTSTPYMYSVNKASGVGHKATLLNDSSVRNDLASTGTSVPLAANQGKILNEKIGDLTTLSTTDKSSTVAAINEVISGLTPVVQTTGVSTTSVMSQNATTSMAYSDPATKYHIVLGDGATNTGGGDGSVAIGRNAHAHGDTVSIGTDSGNGLALADHQINIGHGAGNNADHEQSISIGDYSDADYIGAIAIGSGSNSSNGAKATKRGAIAIGVSATANGERSVALGNGALVDSVGTRSFSLGGQAYARGAVALGAGSAANTEGTVDVGAAWHMNEETWGYLGSDYRLITGVYDPQNAHDAATKGYVDTQDGNIVTRFTPIQTTGSPTSSTEGNAGQLAIDSNTGNVFVCENGSSPYSWKRLALPQEYSTDETDTGMKWINGDTIYSKTVSISSLPSVGAGTVEKSFGIIPVDKIIKHEGVVYDTSTGQTMLPLPYLSTSDPTENIQVSFGISSANNNLFVRIRTATAYPNYSGHVTVYYTKSSQ